MNLEYFQLVDRIIEFDEDGKRIRVEAHVPQQSTIFEGHFPGHPLMPGVLLIETMAQASGWLLLGLLKFERMPFLAAVKEAKMRTFVTPGEVLTVEANVLHSGSGYSITEGRIKVGSKAKCDATLMFRHAPFSNDDLRGHMNEVADRIGFPKELVDG